MEFPFGHHTYHHHQSDDQEHERRERFPPHNSQPSPQPHYQQNEFAPRPPAHRPPEHYQVTEFAPPPSRPPTETFHHSLRPHLPDFLHHHSSSGSGSDLSGKPTCRVFCKAGPNFSLTIRDNRVVLAPSDSSNEFQHWYKDQKYSTRVKDEEGFPSFALVNKATGQAIKHSIGATHPVQLIPYNPDVHDVSILWTESRDLGDGYRAVRMVNNIRLNVDAFNGDKNHGGVHDGTTIVLWEWAKGDNQRWKITPYSFQH